MLFRSETIAYSSEEWQEGRQYNNDRSTVHDYYGYPEYHDAKEIYKKYDISETEVELITNGAYIVTDKTNMYGLMHELAAWQIDKNAMNLRSKINGKIFDTWTRFFQYWTNSCYSFMNIFICVASLLLIWMYEMTGEKKEAVFVLLYLLTNCAMWIYLIWQGRINDHAVIPLQSIF